MRHPIALFCQILTIVLLEVMASTSAQSVTKIFGKSGRLFHVGGDEREVQTAYLLSRDYMDGEDFTSASGKLRIDFYDSTLAQPSSTRVFAYALNCRGGMYFDLKIIDSDGKEFRSAHIQREYTVDYHYVISNKIPPRSQWLDYNLWWAVCHPVISRSLVHGRTVDGNEQFRRYVWEPTRRPFIPTRPSQR